jgi:hypothetical protein
MTAVKQVNARAHERHRIYAKVQIHKESYILVEGFTKNKVSLNPSLSQEVTKTNLQLLTNTTMGHTNFPRFTTQCGSSRATSNHLGEKLQE